jgi:hypothetical protein
MGEAKRRGTYEQRRAEAEAIGKMPYRSEPINVREMDVLTRLELGMYDKRSDGWRRINVEVKG